MPSKGGSRQSHGHADAAPRAVWSGRQDLNLRPPEPHSGALPGCATPRRAAYSTAPTPPSPPRGGGGKKSCSPPQAGEGDEAPTLPSPVNGGGINSYSSPRFLNTMLMGDPSKPKACRSCVSRNRRYEK